MPRRTAAKKAFTAVDVDEDEGDDYEAAPPSVQEVAEALHLPTTDNALSVPMFADTDGRTARSISQLRLLKQEPGGPPAYKGMIPVSSTLDTIGQMFGDGFYTIEGLNHKHTVLAVKENVRIALGAKEAEPALAPTTGTLDVDRVERLARLAAAESHENSKAFVQLVTSVATAAAERDRAFYQAQQERTNAFFISMQQAQLAAFQQTMTMMQAGHNMTIQAIEATTDNKPDRGNDSRQLVETLLQGMRIAGELRGDEPTQPVWADILKGGFGVLSGAVAPALTPPAPQPAQPVEPTSRQKKILRKARKAIDFFDAVRAKGIDPDDLLARLSTLATAAPPPTSAVAAVERPAEPDDEEDEDEGEDEEVLADDDDEDEIDVDADDSTDGDAAQ